MTDNFILYHCMIVTLQHSTLGFNYMIGHIFSKSVTPGCDKMDAPIFNPIPSEKDKIKEKSQIGHFFIDYLFVLYLVLLL